jgi:hypothetical protein
VIEGEKARGAGVDSRDVTNGRARALALVLFMALGVVVLATFRDYGPTIDEEAQSTYGDQVLRWYASGFRDGSATSYENLWLYGGFFEAIAQLGARILPFGLYESRHFVNALFGLLAMAAAYGLGTRLAGRPVGVLSALLLTATPTFYGHIFNNSKDLPFAALFTLSLYFLVLVYQSLPSPPWRLVFALGVSMGLTLAVRIGGVLLFPELLGLWLAFGKGRSRSILRAVVVPLALAWGVMLVFWPWAQLSPLAHPLFALRQTAHFQASWVVLFDGRRIPADKVPWSYLPVLYANTLPEFYFLALLLGGLQALPRVLGFRKGAFDSIVLVGLLIASAGVPVAAAILLHSTLYDGTRHFLFILPPLAVLSGLSLWGALRTSRPWIRWSVGVLLAASLASVLVDMAVLHPYESAYFNRLVCGGLKGAAGRFETDYWGNSYKEGIEWVLAFYEPPAHRRIKVANCSSQFLTGYFLEKTPLARERFLSVRRRDDPDLFLTTTKRDCDKQVRNATVLHLVERQGVPLLYVFEMRRPD